MNAQPRTQLDNEAWLAKRLYVYGINVFAGVTDPNIRKERMRNGIQRRKLAETFCAPSATYAQAFERCYGEPL